jgi:hypothetical protein
MPDDEIPSFGQMTEPMNDENLRLRQLFLLTDLVETLDSYCFSVEEMIEDLKPDFCRQLAGMLRYAANIAEDLAEVPSDHLTNILVTHHASIAKH